MAAGKGLGGGLEGGIADQGSRAFGGDRRVGAVQRGGVGLRVDYRMGPLFGGGRQGRARARVGRLQRGFGAASVYLKDGEGMSDKNRAVLRDVGHLVGG